MAYANVTFKNVYDDETSNNITLGPLDSTATALGNIKSNVNNFNANFTTDTALLMTSKAGAPWKGISAVTITTVDKTVIF